MKKYIKPSVIVVKVQIGHILTASNLNNSYSNSDQLSRRGAFWDDEDMDEE